MNFKEYNSFINNHKYDMTHFIIYYNLKCNEDFSKLKDEEIEKMISLVYKAYENDESNTDLSHICDVAFNHKNDIIGDNFTKWDLLRACYE